jgi:hypothetical protein
LISLYVIVLAKIIINLNKELINFADIMYLPGNNRTIPLVYEFGSLNTRIGYAGESIP